MNVADPSVRRALLWLVILLAPLGLIAGIGDVAPRPAVAQDAAEPTDAGPSQRDARAAEGKQAAEAALADDDDEGGASEGDEKTSPAAVADVEDEIKVLELVFGKGGPLIWPILAMSVLVVTFGAERMLGLRRHKVLPQELIGGLGRLAGENGGFNPRQAYKLCQQYPSAAANVIKTMLLKIGRPHSELEHAVSEANEREAARLYANVRWLSLAAGVTPLLGLLGTVLGMIKAFFDTAHLPVGANKAEYLADGIYQALVTTAAGLTVAIPAAVLAHLFEGQIQKLFRELDETLLGLMPQLERFEGRLRVSRDQMAGNSEKGAVAEPSDPTAQDDGDGQQRPARRAPAAAKPPQQPLPTPK